MMTKNRYSKSIAPMFIFFMLVNTFCFLFKDWLNAKSINYLVLAGGNCILFLLSLFIFFMQKKSLQNANPNAFIRSIMGGTFLKLMVIAGSAVIYLISAGEQRSVYAVIACMGLYFVYTFIEVKTVSRINKEHGGH